MSSENKPEYAKIPAHLIMLIETRSLIPKVPEINLNKESSKKVCYGCIDENNLIFLIKRNWIDVLGTYCHEVGHLKGSYRSFRGVLTPAECKRAFVRASRIAKGGYSPTSSLKIGPIFPSFRVFFSIKAMTSEITKGSGTKISV